MGTVEGAAVGFGPERRRIAGGGAAWARARPPGHETRAGSVTAWAERRSDPRAGVRRAAARTTGSPDPEVGESWWRTSPWIRRATAGAHVSGG